MGRAERVYQILSDRRQRSGQIRVVTGMSAGSASWVISLRKLKTAEFEQAEFEQAEFRALNSTTREMMMMMAITN